MSLEKNEGSVPSPVKAKSSWSPALDALLLLMFLNLSLQPLVDPDFGWHLRTGLDLIKNRQLPKTDPYSHTVPDWPWVEHAWLMDGLIGMTYTGLGSAGGLGVIVLFSAVMTSAFIVGAALACANPTMKLLAIVAVAWTALPFLGARMQMVTLLGLASVLWLWQRYRDGRLATLWLVPPLFLLWANLHGGFTAGLFALGLILTASVAARLTISGRLGLSRRLDEPVLSWSRIRHLALVIGMAALLTLVTPYGWRLYGEIYASVTDRFMIDTLHEWQPVSLQSRAGVIYVVYLAILASGVLVFYRKVEPIRWTILLVFLILSLRHWRNVAFFLLVSLPLCAELLAELSARAKAYFPAERIPAKGASLAAALALALSMVWLGGDHLQRVVRSGLATEEFFRETEYPIEAVQWIRAHRDQVGSRLYNDYGLGGFLLWWLPTEKIFIDGRMPAWRMGDRWILYDYVALTHWDPPALGVLDKYEVDWAIVGRGTPLEKTLEKAMSGNREWRMIYRDQKVSLYVRA